MNMYVDQYVQYNKLVARLQLHRNYRGKYCIKPIYYLFHNIGMGSDYIVIV